MQEIALLISSLAGACTAAAVKKIPRNKLRLQSIGSSSQIKSQINSLQIEKEILTKTITRLYQSDSEITKVQKDKLLLKYQHQLGIVLAKIEKLEASSHHPDLGPIGDGLITLMDQKLSQLDNRLYELSSRIHAASVQVPEVKEKQTEEEEEKELEKKKREELKRKPEAKDIAKEKEAELKQDVTPQQKQQQEKGEIHKEAENTSPKQKEVIELDTAPLEIPYNVPREPFEFTTLTRISKNVKFPEFENLKEKYDISNEITKAQQKVKDRVEIIQQKEEGVESRKLEQQQQRLSDAQKSVSEIKEDSHKIEIPKSITQRSLPSPQKEEEEERIKKPSGPATTTTPPSTTPKKTTRKGDDNNNDYDYSEEDDDDDDLDRIKGEIMRTLSRLEQAEVE